MTPLGTDADNGAHAPRDRTPGAVNPNVSEELDVLRIVTGRLDAAGIPYMVTGSMALNYYAVPRMTRDIDVVAELLDTDVDRVCDLLREDFYLDRDVVRDAVERRTVFNAIHMTLLIKLDVGVRKDTEYRRAEFARRRRVSLDGHDFFVVAPEDLIISKLDWARDTPPEVEARYRAMLLARSGEERMKMGDSMYATARALVVASILERDPSATPGALRRALFLRFYGHEFDAATRERILAALDAESGAGDRATPSAG